MKVIVDLEKCEASGRCYDFAEDIFERGEKGRAKLKMAEVPEDDMDLRTAAEFACNMCPTGAISVEE